MAYQMNYGTDGNNGRKRRTMASTCDHDTWDLHPGHIMVDNQANVTGLIDWTEATHPTHQWTL